MFTFLIAAIAGLATPYVEPQIKTVLESLTLDDLKLQENEFRAFAFGIMMLAAAILAGLGAADLPSGCLQADCSDYSASAFWMPFSHGRKTNDPRRSYNRPRRDRIEFRGSGDGTGRLKYR